MDFFEMYARMVLERNSVADTALMDAASSLQLAGQWAAFLDADRARQNFIECGTIWRRLGHAYGSFLLAAYAPQHASDAIASSVRAMMAIYHNDVDADAPPRELRLLQHPQQQAYLIMAAAVNLDAAGTLHEIADTSPNRRGTAPIGALGVPLRIYWDIGRSLLRPGKGDTEHSAGLVAGHLGQIASAYTQTIESAMANERLWFSGAAPVDVAESDTIAVAMIAAGRLGNDTMRRHIASAVERLESRVARVPLELALQMLENGSGATG
jgi:hypothetical protein